jgi:hypothetical protein
MRTICGFVVAAMLTALAQPAFAACVYRGVAKVCHDDPKYWTPAVAADTQGPEQAAPSAGAPVASLKTIVMQPSASTDNAWVMLPEGGDGASTPGIVPVAVPACEPGKSC